MDGIKADIRSSQEELGVSIGLQCKIRDQINRINNGKLFELESQVEEA